MNSNSQGLLNHLPTTRAFSRCVFGFNQYDHTTSILSFVRGVLYQLTPGGIRDALRQTMIVKHMMDTQIFKSHETKSIYQFTTRLMSNPASPVSFNKLKDQFRVGSVNTIKNYIGYMENSWLLFTMNVYDFSVKRQQIAPKKVYGIDTGLINAVGFGFSPNTGKLLENLIFLALRRKTQDVYYYSSPGGYEVDFYLPEKRQLIQVVQNLDHAATRDREIRALKGAAEVVKVQSALILTDVNRDPFKIDRIPVTVRSVADWLLEE